MPKSQKYTETGRTSEKELRQVAGAENTIYSAIEMMKMEKVNKRKFGVLADLPMYDIHYPQIKKIAALGKHICGCNRGQKGYNDGKIFDPNINLRNTQPINFLQ